MIGYYAKVIAADLKLPAQFAALAPKVREFFAHKAFGKPVNLEDALILKAMSRKAAAYIVRKEFGKALRPALTEQAQPVQTAPPRMLSACPAFPFSRPTFTATKTIFNQVSSENDLERDFAKFLDRAPDVAAFAKLPDQFGFAIEYVDGAANMRYYYPDFVVRLADGAHWLLETKGAETIEVAHKDEAARRWCESATALTGTTWRYKLVKQKAFEDMQPSDFEDLRSL